MTDMTCNCTFMTIAENINVKVEAKIEALVTEKFKYITGRVDALGVDITNIVRVVDGLTAFVDANAPTLDALLRQAESSVQAEPLAQRSIRSRSTRLRLCSRIKCLSLATMRRS